MNQPRSQSPLPRIRPRATCIKLLSLSGILLLLLCGCSSFNRAWRKAEPTPAPSGSVEGRWEGHWLSDVNGHTGKLRCLLSRDADGEYTAWFRATYMSIFSFSYRVPLQVEAQDGVWRFHGSEDLGKLAGGVYRYLGSATPTNFHSIYDSPYDHGTFEMLRP